MISRTSISTLAIAAAVAAVLCLTDLVPEARLRLVLWGLLIWLLVEAAEAREHWAVHRWAPRTRALLRSLLSHALVGLTLVMAFLLAFLGAAILLGARRPDGEWLAAQAAFGLAVLLIAAGAILLTALPELRKRRGL
jgi:hypothetical protein